MEPLTIFTAAAAATTIYGLFYVDLCRAEHLYMSVRGKVMWIWWHCYLLSVVQM
jgi:hypothetical protein